MENMEKEFYSIKNKMLDKAYKQAKYIYVFIKEDLDRNYFVQYEIYFTNTKAIVFIYDGVPIDNWLFVSVEEEPLETFWTTMLGRSMVDDKRAKLVCVKYER